MSISQDTFLSSNFKVEENEVPLFFRFVTSGMRYGCFADLKKMLMRLGTNAQPLKITCKMRDFRS